MKTNVQFYEQVNQLTQNSNSRIRELAQTASFSPHDLVAVAQQPDESLRRSNASMRLKKLITVGRYDSNDRQYALVVSDPCVVTGAEPSVFPQIQGQYTQQNYLRSIPIVSNYHANKLKTLNRSTLLPSAL